MLKMELGSEMHLKIVSVRMPDSVELGGKRPVQGHRTDRRRFHAPEGSPVAGGSAMYRRRLAVDLKSICGFDCRRSIARIEDDIEVIESGLRSLDEPAAAIAKEA